jgi:hypothetical protein
MPHCIQGEIILDIVTDQSPGDEAMLFVWLIAGDVDELTPVGDRVLVKASDPSPFPSPYLVPYLFVR